MLLQDNGKLYIAVRHNHWSSTDTEQTMLLLGFDVSDNTIMFNHRTSGWLGRSSSLARGSGTNIYLGGSYDNTGTNKWDLAFIRLADELATTTQVSRLIYKVNDCGTNTDTGYTDPGDAPYISHMAYMDDGVPQLFGLADSRDKDDLTSSGAFSLIWRVELDANGDASADDSKFRVKVLDST